MGQEQNRDVRLNSELAHDPHEEGAIREGDSEFSEKTGPPRAKKQVWREQGEISRQIGRVNRMISKGNSLAKQRKYPIIGTKREQPVLQEIVDRSMSREHAGPLPLGLDVSAPTREDRTLDYGEATKERSMIQSRHVAASQAAFASERSRSLE